MKANLVAIDLAKSVFQVCVMALGNIVFNRKMSRDQFTLWLAQLEPTVIAMEACATANYWGRKMQAAGHTVRLIAAQHVKAFCRVHKNDRGDALAILEAAQRPKMHFVPVKTVAQQDLQLLLRVRDRLVGQRTEMCNQLRGLASEYGVYFPASRPALIAQATAVLEGSGAALTPVARKALGEVLSDLRGLDERIARLMREMAELSKQDPAYVRLQTAPGFGPVVAATFLSAVGNGEQFARGRDVSAWLGIVPKQVGTGGKVALGHITKNGDRGLRTVLIHGARAVVRWAHRGKDAQSRWICELEARRGRARTIVALANKMARIGWAILRGEADYNAERAFRPKREKALAQSA